MPALTPVALAAALYNEGRRPINGDRILKMIRHIDSRDAFEEMLTALPADAAASVRAQLTDLCERDDKVRGQCITWWP